MKPEMELKLQALLDGELPPAEAAVVRRQAAADPEAASLLAALENVKTAIRESEPGITVPETREFYWSKIARQIQREESGRPAPVLAWPARLQRWLAPLAGAVAVAAVLLLALNQAAPPVLNQVSDMTQGLQTRSFHDNLSGINSVVLRETPQPSARTRSDGSSFVTEME
jgi:anti-sigma factor RsiW